LRRLSIFTPVSHLEPILEPVIERAGFRLVRVRMMGGAEKTLQVMAERPDGAMNVEDCATLSRALLAFLETEDPIEGDYELEVSSPGIDRPLTRLADYSRYAGHEAKIELHAPISVGDSRSDHTTSVGDSRSDHTTSVGDSRSDQTKAGRRRFRGILRGLDGNNVTISVEGQTLSFPFRAIAEAKLVLTDKLINQDLKSRKSA
jgi:ribosome maturation factor RimP